MKKILISAALVGSMLTFYNCKDTPSSEGKSLTKEITFNKEGELTLMKAANDSIIAKLDIEIADDEYSTQTGLMYRNAMAENQGMLFVFNDMQERSFYMKNTQIPLDIIYLNAKKEIVSIQKNAKPFDETSLTSEAASQYVLEVNANLADKWKLEKGDKIDFNKSN
ncbi:DUF192 domain-containing protein [Aequorivita lipolytica]|uniref:DUF192 domain-containing protein n=1 Tax=Aequorivita lipolytica TaxID=153267 RepID=A0A5C6YS03_9FLAO|nr:DUF192 domain-containing protein [Aequorivita lipolytica]TXD69795.1 DUF192 domain-containing protein [Aequorivita lipolytica]SRX50395.1 hypothetical protein AEQU2_00867 [Aequorivita lipolytica]